jgi:RNA polymerase sigma-32 factor
MWWIRAAIQEYVLHSWSLVKMGTTAAQKKLFFNLRKLKGRMEELEQGDLPQETVRAIALELEVPESEVVDMNRRLGGADTSLNGMLGTDGDSEWIEMLPDERPSQEALLADRDEFQQRKERLGAALKTLNTRERDIIIERRLKDDPSTLEELSHRYSVSRERIRQIEVRALEKLRHAMLHAANTSRPNRISAAA